MTDAGLAEALVALRRHDEAVRAELAADGSLFDGYHPRMQAVHDANAARLEALIAAHGWPGQDRVGADAAEAAWIVVQHAIARPDFQRAMLATLRAEAAAGRVPAWQAAYLEDRIAVHEGRPQVYGTQFDWDDDGRMSPRPIADPDGVDARRASVGLGPLEAAVARQRALSADQPRPADRAARRAAYDAWAVRVGWRG